jgi:hypothetical protein
VHFRADVLSTREQLSRLRRERLVRPNVDVETVETTASPTGIPRHAYETPIFKIRESVDQLRWDSWPRIDDAISSYQEFRALREGGVIPQGLRIGLPFPSSALNGFKADFGADYPIAERGYEELVVREVGRLTTEIPRATSRSSGMSATRFWISRASWPGLPATPGSVSPDLSRVSPRRSRRTCSSATTSAMAPSPNGRCTRRGT